MKPTIKKLIRTAEELGWTVTPETLREGVTGYNLSQYSDAGQDFNVSLEAKNAEDTKESPSVLIDSLRSYIDGYDPAEEALLWCGPDGHGRNGAPHDLEDIIADMKDCQNMMEELLSAWTSKPKRFGLPGSYSDRFNKLLNEALAAIDSYRGDKVRLLKNGQRALDYDDAWLLLGNGTPTLRDKREQTRLDKGISEDYGYTDSPITNTFTPQEIFQLADQLSS